MLDVRATIDKHHYADVTPRHMFCGIVQPIRNILRSGEDG